MDKHNLRLLPKTFLDLPIRPKKSKEDSDSPLLRFIREFEKNLDIN